MKIVTRLAGIVLGAALVSTSLFAKKADVWVQDIVKGAYTNYYSINQNKIVDIYPMYFHDWVGKKYASDHGIDAQKMFSRAEKNAKDFAIGYANSYLGVINPKYNPKNYYVIIDNYDVAYKESDYTLSSIVSGNIIILKK